MTCGWNVLKLSKIMWRWCLDGTLREVKAIKEIFSQTLIVIAILDQTCKYEVALHRESEEFRDEDMSDSNLYYKEYDDLKFDATYNFAVRGKNTKNNSLESSLFWFEFETPSCWKVLGINSTVCPPEDIKELNASFTHIKENLFTLDVQWNRMNHIPEFFALQLGDSISNGDDETGAGIYNFTIDAVRLPI